MTAASGPGDPNVPNLDEFWWNENWLRITQAAMEEGTIQPDELGAALADAQARLAGMAGAPRPITQIELYRGVVYPVGGPIPPAFLAPPHPPGRRVRSRVVDVAANPLSSWTLSPLVAHLFAGAFAVPDAGPCRGFILLADVPAERIISNGLTGLGNLQLAEHIIMGSRMPAAVREVPHVEPQEGET